MPKKYINCNFEKAKVLYKRSYIMCKAAEVGKIVINKCIDQEIFINTQKLQKLLVLMQVECIKRSNKALFKEDIVIWSCGVAIKEVDVEFASEATGFFYKQQEYISLLDKELESIDYIIEEYGHCNAYEINQLKEIQDLYELGELRAESGVPHIKEQKLLEKYTNNEIN